jgi:hypothetical protein
MLKIIFRLIVSFSFVLFFLSDSLAQENSVSYGEMQVIRFVNDKGISYQGIAHISDGNQEVVDLSMSLKEKCDKTVMDKVGQNLVEVKFSAKSSAEAMGVLWAFRAVVEITQQRLIPLAVRGVRIYLFPLDEVVKNYKILVPEQEEYYQLIKPYKTLDEIKLQCEKATMFCQDIFSDAPHELTHLALWTLTANKREEDKIYPRWFEEGIAEYVAAQVAQKLMPVVADYQSSTKLPEASLSRKEIREKIFEWRRYETEADSPVTRFSWLPDNPSMESYSWNQSALYGASRHLVELILLESEMKGIENPLVVLFQAMKKQIEKSGKPLGNTEIMSIIRQKLRVEPTRLGQLSVAEQEKMITGAIKFLERNFTEGEPKKNNIEKYKALSVLASLDAPIKGTSLLMLLRFVYDTKQNDYFIGLAATGLARRVTQPEFEETIKKSLQGDSNLQGKSVKSIKADLQKLSFRPPQK